MNGIYARDILPDDDYGIPVAKKLEHASPSSLKDGELLMACLSLPKKLAGDLLENRSLPGITSLPGQELDTLLGKKRAIRLNCLIELGRRMFPRENPHQPTISCPAEALPHLGEIRQQPKEHFLCLYLNARHQAIHKEVVSIGSLSASIVHPREVFQPAIVRNAACVILGHNHPSEDCSPSKDDIELTRRLAKAGEIIGIDVLDHLIVSAADFISLKEKGLM